MASTYPFKKATAVTIIFPILDADGDPVPDAAGLDSSYSLDGAQFVACTNEAVNILNPAPAITNTGLYSLTLVAGETNGDSVAIQVKTSTSGAKTTMMVFYTSAQTDNETKAVIDDIPTTTEFNARTLLASEYQRILASGTLTFSSMTVPADTGRLEVNDYWNGCLLVPLTGADAYQPKMIRSFANTGGVFTLDRPFTTLPGLVTYIILAFQKDATVAQTGEATTALTAYDTGKGVAKDDTVAKDVTVQKILGSGVLSVDSKTVPADAGRLEVDNYWKGCLLVTTVGAVANQPRLIQSFSAGVFILDAPFTTLPGLSAYKILAFQKDATVAQTGEAATYSSMGEAQTWSAKGEAAAALTAYAMGLGVAVSGEAAAALAAWVLAYGPAKEATLLRVLGLVQENTRIDTTVFDADDHMTSARLRTFTDATLTVMLATYTITATYDVDGNLASYQVVKV